MEYRVGSEGWTEAAKAGLPLVCDVSARWDPEAVVFVAESEDFLPAFACVAESSTWEGLGKELDAVFSDALESVLGYQESLPRVTPRIRFA